MIGNQPAATVAPNFRSTDIGETSSEAAAENETEEVRIASWIEKKPDLKVVFTTRAEKNLAQFESSGRKLLHFSDVSSLRRSICDILSGDPRSVYRRRKCLDRLFYFNVDLANVTSWFDVNDDDDRTEVAEVLKITFQSSPSES